MNAALCGNQLFQAIELRRFLTCLVLLTACGDSPSSSTGSVGELPPLGDVAALSGTWEGELRAGSRLTRLIGIAPTVSLTVQLGPHQESDGQGLHPAGTVRGLFASNLARVVERPPRVASPLAGGAIFASDSVFLRLGLCCDGGELELYGHVDDDRLRGVWWQIFHGGGPSGTFELQRTNDAIPQLPHN